MKLMKQLKEVLAEGKEQIYKTSEVLAGKLKDVSEESLEISRELFAEIGARTNEIGNAARMKFEINSLHSELREKYGQLGDLICKMYAARKRESYQKQFEKSIAGIEMHKQLIEKKTFEYENARRKFSDRFMMNRLGNELEAGEALIERVEVKSNSTVLNKKLKDIELPKKALISAVKRKEEIIIPDGNTRLLAGDILTVIGKKKDVAKLIQTYFA